MKFLLFDMDDVLLMPGAYHRALQQTVRLVAAALGYGELNLSQGDIQAFEAAGVYSEWDTSAICAALMLENAWTFDPAIQLPGTGSVTDRARQASSHPATGLQPLRQPVEGTRAARSASPAAYRAFAPG